MKPESWIHRLLRRIGLIKEGTDDPSFKQVMCKKAVEANICSGRCGSCAWNIRKEAEA